MKKIKRILVVRVGNIGDVLMATPFIRRLKKTFPDAILDFLTSPQAEFTVKANPYIDNIYIYRKYHKFERKVKRFFFKRFLSKNTYEMCFALELNAEYLGFIKDIISKDTLKIGFSDNIASEFLDKKIPFSYNTHVIKSYLLLLKNFFNVSLDIESMNMEFHFPERIHDTIENKLKKEFVNIDRYFILHPGCTELSPYNRGWSFEKISQIVDFLVRKNFFVFLTGKANERIAISKILKQCRDTKRVIVFLERDLYELSYLISNAVGVLCPDTGILHLARALNVSVVGLFGPSNPCHTGAIGEGKYRIIREDFKCGPCNNIEKDKRIECTKTVIVPCMDAISTNEVISAIDEVCF